MIRPSKFQRLALLAASTTVITGGALAHGSAFAAEAGPRTAQVSATSHLDATTQWRQITDSSGITVRLPGEPQVQKDNKDGIISRDYAVRTGYGVMGFAVFEAPGTDPSAPWDLSGGIKDAVDGYNTTDTHAHLRSTGDHEGTTKTGDHFVEAKLAGADGRVGHIRIVDHGRQALMIMTVGTGEQQHAVDQDYQQVLDSIHGPDHAAPTPVGPATST
ncbi:hypothetical protein AB5J72_20205 [Streptomyces sp. CG1]|uniref:hypothetical protein n=1 Tax=Streptomyces sp. CG1 TaxID=1287523 RepID=UPI0034E1F374